ncbi:hypothetical protein HPP92_027389 [Vanilla planifolia]|uniref:Uncharacterized protein n=1 Tax=Vanilla planifolia TaxID=51239 RepID=A0A835U5M1_VANPL|nr:hypothetical protein HPP92_027389 [Vanilla planifolia]KAG0449358.1 hypothetical protein HPP92_027398 [Vanilla planifolia]
MEEGERKERIKDEGCKEWREEGNKYKELEELKKEWVEKWEEELEEKLEEKELKEKDEKLDEELEESEKILE